jgi:3-methylfumaryl-CoA hydratase
MYEEWVGVRMVSRDVVTESPARRLAATIDREDLDLRRGDALPPMWHWLYFHTEARTEELGPDGHSPWNGMQAPVELPRRMFAGGSTEFHKGLVIGSEATKTETVELVEVKTAATGDPLLFLTFVSEVEDESGPVLTERRSIVYTTPAKERPAAESSPAPAGGWSRTVIPSEAMLFRFSALTWNAHRIHYDAPFAVGVDGHPTLVVHGPLTAILLLDLWSRNSSGDPGSFSFRATRPAYVNRPLRLVGDPSGSLAARDTTGAVVMTALVTTRP